MAVGNTTDASQVPSGSKKSFLTGALQLPGKFVSGIFAVAKSPFVTPEIATQKTSFEEVAQTFSTTCTPASGSGPGQLTITPKLINDINVQLAAVEQSAYELDAISNQRKTVWFWIASHAALFVFNPVLGTGLIIVDGIATYLDKIHFHQKGGNWRLRTAAVLNTRFFARAGVFRFSTAQGCEGAQTHLRNALETLETLKKEIAVCSLAAKLVDKGVAQSFCDAGSFDDFLSTQAASQTSQPEAEEAKLEDKYSEIQELIQALPGDQKEELYANTRRKIEAYIEVDDAGNKTFKDHPYKDLAARHSALTKITKNLDALIAPSSAPAGLSASGGV